ncbi:MAG: hypothetical protein ACLSDQ_07830 [Adlercreutzia equolifaciens]
MSVRKTCYERDNRTPTLIADRAPMANREDLWSLLDECGMDYWDPLEWLVRSPGAISATSCTSAQCPKVPLVSWGWRRLLRLRRTRPRPLARYLLLLCAGDAVECEGEPLGGAERKVLYESFMLLHEKASRGGGPRREAEACGSPGAPTEARRRADAPRGHCPLPRPRVDRCEGGREHRGEATFYRRIAEWEQQEG